MHQASRSAQNESRYTYRMYNASQYIHILSQVLLINNTRTNVLRGTWHYQRANGVFAPFPEATAARLQQVKCLQRRLAPTQPPLRQPTTYPSQNMGCRAKTVSTSATIVESQGSTWALSCKVAAALRTSVLSCMAIRGIATWWARAGAVHGGGELAESWGRIILRACHVWCLQNCWRRNSHVMTWPVMGCGSARERKRKKEWEKARTSHGSKNPREGRGDVE